MSLSGISEASSNTHHDGFYVDVFNGGTLSGNTATFELNEATNNTNQGYDITGTPASGSGTNTGSGNGSHDSF